MYILRSGGTNVKKGKYIAVGAAAAMLFTAVSCSGKKEITSAGGSGDIKNISPRGIVFDWQSKYEEKLNFFSDSDKYHAVSQNGIGASMFDLRDLNNDGTPELIISPDTQRTTTCEIYTVSGGQLVELGEIGGYGTLTFLPGLSLINDEYNGNGFVIGKYLGINNGEISPVLTYSDNTGSAASGATIIHEINGESVTLPEFDEAMQPYRDEKGTSIGRKYSFGDIALSYAVHCSESWGAVLTPGEKSLFKEQLGKSMNEAAQTGSDAAFELCDLNGDEVPELIVSQGTQAGDLCKIYYIQNKNLSELEGSFGYGGRLSFDFEKMVFYATDSPNKNSCWTLTGADLNNFTASGNTMECGRKFPLNSDSMTAAFR